VKPESYVTDSSKALKNTEKLGIIKVRVHPKNIPVFHYAEEVMYRWFWLGIDLASINMSV
jgi:hypothetical protein